MDENLLKLVFGNESEFQREIMSEEVEQINKEFPLSNNNFDFKINYIVENEDDYEVEFYFRNNMKVDLTFGNVPLHFVYDDAVIAITVVDFKKEFGDIKSKSIKVCRFNIEKSKVYYPEHLYNSELKLGVNVEYKVEETIEEEIVNMPKDLPYDQKNYFESKIKSLPNLIKNTYDIRTLAISGDKDGNVDIVLLIRNGYNKEILIKEMPMALLNKEEIPIYFGTFKSDNISVQGEKSRIFLYKIPKAALIKSYDNYEGFTVKIKE